MKTISQLLYFKKVYNKILNIANFTFPYYCIFCQAYTKNYDLCNACLDDLPFIQYSCSRCALPMVTENRLCGACLDSPPPFHLAHSLLEFNWQTQFLIHALKYKKNPALAKLLTTLLIKHIKITNFPDALLPVPLHHKRLKQRGFNQSQLITNQLAKHYQLPLIQHVIRSKNTPSQTGLNKKQRKNNLKNAFQITRPLNKNVTHIAIIDDVMTTGATVAELSQLLVNSNNDIDNHG